MKLILGYGNTLRTDDGLGRHIAEALDGIAVPQLNPEVAESISELDFLVLIDACYGEKAGEISFKTIDAEAGAAMTHQSSPANLLQMAKNLYGAAPKTLLITISGASFDYGDNLSPQIKAMLPDLIKQVQAIIQSHDKT